MLRKQTNEILIKPKISNRVRFAISAGVLGLLAASLFLAYDFGKKSGHRQFDQDNEMIVQLNDSIAKLRAELETSQENLVIAQRHRQIQEEAYKQISAAYASSEQKNRYLGSRLDFYRSIISPKDGQSGPLIQALESREENGNVNFDVTLVQAIKHKHQVRGSLRLELYHGDTLKGQWPESSPRSINFQYFEQVSGVFEGAKLADDARIRVELSILDGEPVERWFDLSASDGPVAATISGR